MKAHILLAQTSSVSSRESHPLDALVRIKGDGQFVTSGGTSGRSVVTTVTVGFLGNGVEDLNIIPATSV